MIPDQVFKRKLSYNQIRQAIQKIILQEQKFDEEIISSEVVDRFIRSHLAKDRK